MFRFVLLALTAAIIGAVSAQSNPSRGSDPVRRVLLQGTDGPTQQFNVQCRDERVATIIVNGETHQTCVQQQGTPPLCRKTWMIRHAAKAACGD